jgi:putative membrane protein
MATTSNMFEIESSELALTKTQLESVQEFAEHMVEDHTAAGEDMQAAVSEQGGVTVPTALDEKHAGMLSELEAASGEQFDQLYIQMQTQAHQEAVALFQSYSENGPDGEIKDFASDTLPTLEEHYDEITSIAVE